MATPLTPSISSRTDVQLVELVLPCLPGEGELHPRSQEPSIPEGPSPPTPHTLRPPGLIDSVGVDMHALRPAVIKAQAAMKAGYE